MSLSRDESRALAFVALLLLLAGAARVAGRGPAVQWTGDAVDTDSLEQVARERLESAERRRRPLAPGERIDPNTASEEELDRLPGVGPSVARRIVASREADGAFRTLEDLTRVRGIGQRSLERLGPYLELPRAGAGSRSTITAGSSVPRGRPVVRPPGEVLESAGSRRTTGSGVGTGSSTAAAPLDLNRATAAELETLSGIGPALAARIVAYRDSVGGFASVEELGRVRGIGPATLERLRPRVYVQP